MIHQGDALRALLKKEGVTLSALARRMHVHANTITNYVQSPELKLDVWRQIGSALKRDLSDLVPGLPSFAPASRASTDPPGPPLPVATPKVPESLSSCQKELFRVQAAYIQLMEEHLELVRRTANAA